MSASPNLTSMQKYTRRLGEQHLTTLLLPAHLEAVAGAADYETSNGAFATSAQGLCRFQVHELDIPAIDLKHYVFCKYL